MKTSKIKNSLPHVARVTQKGGLMVSFVTLRGTLGVEQKLRRMAGADWVRSAPHPTEGHLQLWHVMTNIPRKVASEVKLSQEEQVRDAVVRAVKESLSLDSLERMSEDNAGIYKLSISVDINEFKKLVQAKTTGSIKLVSSGETLLNDSRQMELDLPSGRCCEECGWDISDQPDYHKLCPDCYRDTYCN